MSYCHRRVFSPIGKLTLPLEAGVPARPGAGACAAARSSLASNLYDLTVHLPGWQPRRARIIHSIGEQLLETSWSVSAALRYSWL